MSLRGLCGKLDLSDKQCNYLKRNINSLCSGRGRVGKKRKVSNWQRCIKEHMSGKKWDPSRIKEAAKLYRAGKCPSG